MSVRSGIAGQVGVALESTYGTGVTPTQFLYVSKFDAKKVKNVEQGQALAGAGRLMELESQRVLTTKAATVGVEFDIQNKSMGRLFQALMGTSVTPVQQASTTAYLQTHTLADNFGKSLTMQGGIPDRSGTVNPYTFLGCKVKGADLSFEVGKIATAKFDLDARDVTEATGLATASFATAQRPFVGTDGSIKVGTFASEASVSGVTKASVKIDRPMQEDAFYFGGSGLKAEPVQNGPVKITGSITADFVDKTVFADRFVSDAGFSLVIELVGPVIESTYYHTFRITLPACHLDGDTPVLDGPEVVNGDFPFTCLFDGTNLPKIEIISTDTAV